MSSLVDRFLRYIQIDTQSDPDSSTYPSTSKQLSLAKLLVDELKQLGIQDAGMDHYGYVTGTLPSNIKSKAPAIGFLAHMDTSPSSPGKDVKPKIIESYDGKEILLNSNLDLVLSPAEFPTLKNYVGQTIITTDGTTLLGADNKAGIAAIMSAVEWITQHPGFKHGDFKIGFTPDEEIGRGVDHFDVKKFGADFAFTMDGDELGKLEYENFNAASAKVTIHGKQVHPGTAKGIMKNSQLIAMELQQMLPEMERPEFTEKRQGFIHLDQLNGTVETTKMEYIIRDHDKVLFERKKILMQQACDFLNTRHGKGTVDLKLEDSYFNMKEKIDPVMHIVDNARQAMLSLGITPKEEAVRGGTDGARLSYMGLPCPNIFSGGLNFHSRFEYVPVPSMEKSKEVILKILEIYANS
jgi:tripeptide aminopeptidase